MIGRTNKFNIFASLVLLASLTGCASLVTDGSQITKEAGIIKLEPQTAKTSSPDDVEIKIGLTQDSKALWLNVSMDTVLLPKGIAMVVDGREDVIDAYPSRASYDITGKDTEWTHFTVGFPRSVLKSWSKADMISLTIMTSKKNYERDLGHKENAEIRVYIDKFLSEID
jgi:hypothetical protein